MYMSCVRLLRLVELWTNDCCLFVYHSCPYCREQSFLKVGFPTLEIYWHLNAVLSNMLTSRAWWWGLAVDFIERDTRMGFFLVRVLDQTWLDEKPVQRLMCQERRGRKQQFLWLTQIEALPPPQRAHAIICKSTLRWHKTSKGRKVPNQCTHALSHSGLCSLNIVQCQSQYHWTVSRISRKCKAAIICAMRCCNHL